MAENQDRIKNIFINTEYPKEGLLAVKLYIKGKPEIVTIDDYLPFYYSSPFFARRSSDGDFWMAFMEKIYAKINGNYESIIGGWQSESWRILNGAPTKFFMLNTLNANSAWNLIVTGLNQGHLVGVDTSPSANFYGIAPSHAYTIVSAHVIRETNGAIKDYLYRIKNPWGSDSYSGPWHDGDGRWNAYYRSQVPYVNSNDGYFFMSKDDLLRAYYYFQINFQNENWNVNYYEKLNDDGNWKQYHFTVPRT